MRRRKLRWVLALAALAVVAAGAVLLWLPRDPITRKNYDRIQDGMTRTQAEAILGPPGINGAVTRRFDEEDFDEGGFIRAGEWDYYPFFGEDPEVGLWIGDAGIIAVYFHHGRAGAKGWFPRSSPLQRLRHRWQRWFPE